MDLVRSSQKIRSGSRDFLGGLRVHRGQIWRFLPCARDLFEKGRNHSAFALLLVSFLAFLKSYFLRREFVDGIDGVAASHMYAFQCFIRLAKARELHRLARKGK